MTTFHYNRTNKVPRNYRWADMLWLLNALSSMFVALVGGGYFYVGSDGSAMMLLPMFVSFVTMATVNRYVDVEQSRRGTRGY